MVLHTVDWMWALVDPQETSAFLVTLRGIFVTERTETLFLKLLFRRTQAATVFWNFYPCHLFHQVSRVLLSYRSSFKETGIFCTVPEITTNSLSDQILSHSVRSGTCFFWKTALVIPIIKLKLITKLVIKTKGCDTINYFYYLQVLLLAGVARSV
jgi:hypothetical protein